MAAGYIAPPYASTIEEEANLQEVRYRINSLKSQNEALRDEMKRVMKDNHKQTEKAFWARRHTQDLQDRAQYIRIATISNPAPIGQYCPKLKGPPPDEYYLDQIAKVRQKTQQQLMQEAARLKGQQLSPQGRAPRVKEIPCNFSPAIGTESSVQKLRDPVLLGLRNQTHWNSNRKYGKLPELLPRDSETHGFKEHTNSWMARSGEASPARNRNYVSMMTRSRSQPSL
ncbi:unnamed protein product [Effrenium voratum]|uniref:Uncharacterized protein n=1 Tax=Effrenium voratum TaxID=2562239 RepID=A0AA36JCD8_9DINO|nr:unnamed protein product [Effrenium voratum]CAJ1403091.1 unnamed protein product [Effrenium voratum]